MHGKLQNEKLHNLYTQNIITVIKSEKIRWVGHIACVLELRNEHFISFRKPKERHHLTELGVGGRTILKWILE
jgi:hypothetical protein